MSPSPAPAAPRPPLRVALAGLGVVGGGVVRLLQVNRDLIARRAGRAIEIVALSARDRHKDRGVDLSAYRWEDDLDALVAAEDVDVVVEMIGGADGMALTLARHTLGAGKALVTANKAMIAHHGLDLARLAETKDTPLKYEAAVAGGGAAVELVADAAAGEAAADTAKDNDDDEEARGDAHPADRTRAQPRRITRATSRSISRFLIDSRLSSWLLPLPTPIKTLAHGPLKYMRSGTSV